MKNSFVLFTEYGDKLALLTDEQFGKLMRAIFHYEKTGETLELEPINQIAFSFITSDLDRAKTKYNQTVENGKKGGRPKTENNQSITKANQSITQQNLNETRVIENETENNQTKPNHNLNEDDNDNVNVDDNESDISSCEDISPARYRERYTCSQRTVIDNFFEILKHTRKSCKLADSVIIGIYQDWEKYEPTKVIYALEKYINNPNLHDKRENYVLGIIRNTNMSEVGRAKARAPTSGKSSSFNINEVEKASMEKYG